MKPLRICFWTLYGALLGCALLSAWLIGILFVWVMQVLHP